MSTENFNIVNDIVKQRQGHYVHALEVTTVYELHEILQSLVSEFVQQERTLEDIVSFFDTISIYSLSDIPMEEELIYELNIVERVKELYHESIIR